MIHYQGDLDRLCGVYAIMNAMDAMAGRRQRKDRYNALFKVLCDRLMEEGKFPKVLYGGMSDSTVEKLLESACRFINTQGWKVGFGFSFPFREACLVVEKEYFCSLEQQDYDFGSGAIILRLLGRHNHWTCVRRITRKNIHLLDSMGLQRISRHRCVINEGKGLHILVPRETVFLFHREGLFATQQPPAKAGGLKLRTESPDTG